MRIVCLPEGLTRVGYETSSLSSRQALDKFWPEPSCYDYRCVFPYFHGQSVFRIIHAQVGQLVTVHQVILPVKRIQLGAPLFLESEGALVRGRAPEAEG